MAVRPLATRVVLAGLVPALAGCDPGVHVAWQKDFHGAVDHGCIEAALRAVAADVRRGSYQSDGKGPRGFESGTNVTQFTYSDPSLPGGYALDVAAQPGGRTHYWHGWSKLGTTIPADEQRRVVPLLMRANRSVEQRCGLSFAGTAPQAGEG